MGCFIHNVVVLALFACTTFDFTLANDPLKNTDSTADDMANQVNEEFQKFQLCLYNMSVYFKITINEKNLNCIASYITALSNINCMKNAIMYLKLSNSDREKIELRRKSDRKKLGIVKLTPYLHYYISLEKDWDSSEIDNPDDFCSKNDPSSKEEVSPESTKLEDQSCLKQLAEFIKIYKKKGNVAKYALYDVALDDFENTAGSSNEKDVPQEKNYRNKYMRHIIEKIKVKNSIKTPEGICYEAVGFASDGLDKEDE